MEKGARKINRGADIRQRNGGWVEIDNISRGNTTEQKEREDTGERDSWTADGSAVKLVGQASE